MAGIPPLLGFVAKEAVFTSLISAIEQGSFWAWVALIGLVLGSILTVAYSARFFWGAFARKKGLEDTELHAEPWIFTAAPVLLAAAGAAGGLAASVLDPLVAVYADTLPYAAPDADPQLAAAAESSAHGGYYLALWHGFEPALGLSAWLSRSVSFSSPSGSPSPVRSRCCRTGSTRPRATGPPSAGSTVWRARSPSSCSGARSPAISR
ncbi:Na(+)/H(+) antiporter subunit A [Rathayibacter tanaceti]|uniref:Na(+)/H(+) antiporter subunit A n=1 Tax=Rathayibacter tanaceti TaxID=1671680 RepID=A0A166IA68_9MICO|nr:Na(+)/H(+) antiporter subunit A [Rathayibacter tanaceti]